MDWTSALIVVACTSAVTVGVVVLWAFGHLRETFQKNVVRQADHLRRLFEKIEKLQIQLEDANARIAAVTEQNGRLTRAVAGLVDRRMEESDAPADNPPNRLLH